MATSSSFLPAIEKLNGRENFSTWQFGVQNYLEHEGLWESVLGTETDAAKNLKAKTKIILLINPINYVHVRTCTTAKQVWDKLQTTFADSGLFRRVSLIRQLTTTKLENCANIEEYVTTILSASHKLSMLPGNNIDDEWIGTFLLAGLPDRYKPMIMTFESSGIALTSDLVKTKLLQEDKSISTGTSMALHTYKPNISQSASHTHHIFTTEQTVGKQKPNLTYYVVIE